MPVRCGVVTVPRNREQWVRGSELEYLAVCQSGRREPERCAKRVAADSEIEGSYEGYLCPHRDGELEPSLPRILPGRRECSLEVVEGLWCAASVLRGMQCHDQAPRSFVRDLYELTCDLRGLRLVFENFPDPAFVGADDRPVQLNRNAVGAVQTRAWSKPGSLGSVLGVE